MSSPFGADAENVAVASGAVDSMFAGAEDVAPSERNVGYEPLPAFGDYVLKFVKAEGRTFEKSGNSGLTVQVQVEEGPGDTAGRKTGYMNVVFFKPKRTDAKGQIISEEKYQEKRKNLIATLKRLNKAIGRPEMTFPASVDSEAALQAWAAGFADKTVIARLEIETTDDNKVQNRIVADSIEALDGPAFKREGKKRVVDPTKTALQAAREAIAAENAKQEKSAGTAGARKDKGPF